MCSTSIYMYESGLHILLWTQWEKYRSGHLVQYWNLWIWSTNYVANPPILSLKQLCMQRLKTRSRDYVTSPSVKEQNKY
jgi:hypothetical protein